jgi:branched-chain amino acid aminotransferase
MTLAFRNGAWIAPEELFVPVTDAGFLLGATVAEQLRTFQGRLFCLEKHLDRLEHSLAIVGVDPRLSRQQLAAAAEELAKHNHEELAAGDDLGLTIFVTPGPYSTYVPEGGPPLVAMHTFPLSFRLWADKYEKGQALLLSDVRQVPADCWPTELKCRSRMHYYLADRHAHARQPGARALLLDLNGEVTESSTANIVLFRNNEGLVAPRSENILPGVSVAVLKELAKLLDIPFQHRGLVVADVESADEIFLTSTSPCMVPVTQFEGRPVGGGRPGPMFHRLITAWNERCGLDIRRQAKEFAQR